MEIKVFYVFSDLSESNSGNLWLMPGSHKRPLQEWREARGELDLSEAGRTQVETGGCGPVAHSDLALCWSKPIGQNPQDYARRLPLPVAPSGGFHSAVTGVGR